MRMLAGLARTAHLGPCLAITVLTVLVGVASGVGALTLLGVGFVVLLGQLSIGWSNDVIDADRDLSVTEEDQVRRAVLRRLESTGLEEWANIEVTTDPQLAE